MPILWSRHTPPVCYHDSTKPVAPQLEYFTVFSDIFWAESRVRTQILPPGGNVTILGVGNAVPGVPSGAMRKHRARKIASSGGSVFADAVGIGGTARGPFPTFSFQMPEAEFLPSAFMRGVARRAGGSPHICEANMRKCPLRPRWRSATSPIWAAPKQGRLGGAVPYMVRIKS